MAGRWIRAGAGVPPRRHGSARESRRPAAGFVRPIPVASAAIPRQRLVGAG